MCQIHHIRLLLSDYCNKIHAPITGEGIPGKKIKNDQAWRQFLRPADVKDILDHIQEPKSLWSDCLVNKIKKRQTIVQKKEKEKKKRKMNMLREIGLQILKFWRFSFDFMLS